jgi:hypothetical protein
VYHHAILLDKKYLDDIFIVICTGFRKER